jgi:hypothetical protein
VPYRAINRHFARSGRAIRAELRSGPLTPREVAERIAAREGLDAERCHDTVRRSLSGMKAKGQVRNGLGVWWLPN